MKFLNHERNITQIINNTTKKLFNSKGFCLFKLMSEWPNIIDPSYVEYCLPVSIKNLGKNKKRLEIEIYNSGVVFDLQYGKETIISNINSFFKQEVVTDISFKLVERSVIKQQKKKKSTTSNNIIPKDLEQEILQIDDEQIRNNLLKIAQTKL